MLTDNEQLFLELVNAARLDPLGEAARQGIDLNEGLPNPDQGWEEIAPTPVQALAPNAQIQQAAADHGQWMLDTDTFSHTGAGGSSPGDRMEDAGYVFEGTWSWSENIAMLNTTGLLDAEAAIGTHFDGLYESPGHRVNMFNADFRETGVAQSLGEFTAEGSDGVVRDWNTSMLTHKFGLSGNSVFLTGIIYNDTDFDGFYSVGEGRDNFEVSAAGTATATWAAGGYSLALDSDPAVSVTLGSGASALQVTVDLSGGNVKLDLVNGERILTSGDIVMGAGALDVQMLGAVNNSVTGNALDNIFYVGRGDNIMSGGGGLDRVVFTGQRSDFDIIDTGNGQVTVADLRTGPESDGTNTLTDMAFLQFTDETVSLSETGTDAMLSGNLSLPNATALGDTALRFTLSDGSEQLVETDGAGAFDLVLPTGLTGHLDMAPGAANPGALDVGDALDVLRLAVGLEPSFGPATPYDLIAADVDFSGQIDVNDALNVLRVAVGLDVQGASPGQYVLIDPDDPLDGLSPNNVAYASGVDLDQTMVGDTLDLQVVLLGDLGASHAV